MKRSTKKIVMALVIVLIFGMSSIAFFATSFVHPQVQNEFKPLESPVVEGTLDPSYKPAYVQAGYTWIEYYYSNRDAEFSAFLEGLPESLASQTGAPQIIVQKINEKYLGNENYLVVESAYGQESFSELDQQKTFEALCRLLTSRPIECGLGNFSA